jgi:hypothetical protein
MCLVNRTPPLLKIWWTSTFIKFYEKTTLILPGIRHVLLIFMIFPYCHILYNKNPSSSPPYIYIFLCSIKAHLVNYSFISAHKSYFFFAMWVTKSKSSPCQRLLVIGFCANSDHKMKNGGIKNECFICK